MKKTVAFVLALLLLCGSAICEGLAETNRGGGTASTSLLLENDGIYVGEDGDLKPGWYSVTPEKDEFCCFAVAEFDSSGEPHIAYTYSGGRAGGSAFVSFSNSLPEEYLLPLWEGCYVLHGYSGNLICDQDTLSWDKANSGSVNFEQIGILPSEEAQRQELLHASDAGAEAAEKYRKSAERYAYVSSLDPNKDVIYEIKSGQKWTVGKSMESGVYLLLYLGNDWANVEVASGELTDDDYIFASYNWSSETGTEYEEYAFPLVEGCTLACETSQKNDLDCVWLVKLADVD